MWIKMYLTWKLFKIWNSACAFKLKCNFGPWSNIELKLFSYLWSNLWNQLTKFRNIFFASKSDFDSDWDFFKEMWKQLQMHFWSLAKVVWSIMRKKINVRLVPSQGYRDRYDIIDHGHKKKTFMCFVHRSVFAEIWDVANHCFSDKVSRIGCKSFRYFDCLEDCCISRRASQLLFT